MSDYSETDYQKDLDFLRENDGIMWEFITHDPTGKKQYIGRHRFYFDTMYLRFRAIGDIKIVAQLSEDWLTDFTEDISEKTIGKPTYDYFKSVLHRVEKYQREHSIKHPDNNSARKEFESYFNILKACEIFIQPIELLREWLNSVYRLPDINLQKKGLHRIIRIFHDCLDAGDFDNIPEAAKFLREVENEIDMRDYLGSSSEGEQEDKKDTLCFVCGKPVPPRRVMFHTHGYFYCSDKCRKDAQNQRQK